MIPSILWDVVVVGAGVAGITLATALARTGCAVVLVDKGRFPRSKACGGTLNPRAVDSLHRLGYGELLTSLHPASIEGIEWRMGLHQRATMPFALHRGSGALAVSRWALDAALLDDALRAGVTFLDAARCTGSELRDDHRIVRLRSSEGEASLMGRVVIGADGLASALHAEVTCRSGGGYLGCSALVAAGGVSGAAPNCITMAIGRRGYAGVVQVENGKSNVAAAVRVDALGKGSGPDDVAREILRSAGVELEDQAIAPWCVTVPGLRRRVSRPWAERSILVGDAAGYHAPITGEGMASALAGVEGALPLLRDGWNARTGREWESEWRRRVGSRSAMVRVAGFIAGSPLLTKVSLSALRAFPAAGCALTANLARAEAVQ